MNPTDYCYNDGGRAEAGYQGHSGDCVVRAISIATQKPYQEVYDAIGELAKRERTGKRKRGISNPRTGVYRQTYMRYMLSIGWKWVPTMQIGQGCKVHLRKAELPSGRLVVSLSRHLAAVIDGVVHDTTDPCRGGVRCVYGYFMEPKQEPKPMTKDEILLEIKGTYEDRKEKGIITFYEQAILEQINKLKELNNKQSK